MKKIEKWYKIGLFTCFVSLLVLMHVQKWRSWWKLEPLFGYFQVPEVPKLTSESWLDGTYQSKKEKQIEESIGFRSLLVRMYNQWYYSLFNQARANGVSIGKDNYLYEEGYIKTALGDDFLGENEISSRLDSLQHIADYLKTKNITLFVVLASGKGEFFSANWPLEFKNEKPSRTNYLEFSEGLSNRNIPTLDLQRWFLQMKDTATYPLFPKTGIHWSTFADILVADTLFKFVHQNHPSFHYPSIQPSNINFSETMYLRDDDIEKGMNLLFNIPDNKMAYADVKIEGDTMNVSSDFLIIADSYYFGIEGLLRDNTKLPSGNFWYYNKQVYPASYSEQVLVEDLDYKKELEKNQVVILLSTDMNLRKFGFGFMQQFYDVYFSENE